MRRRYLPYVLAATSVLAVACSDSTAPTLPSQSELAPIQQLDAVGSASSRKSDDVSKTVTFELHPQGGRQYIGAFRLDYPARVVCDPVKSEYGSNAWKKACETLDVPFTITAQYSVINGMPHVDFQPNVRFDPSKVVTLTADIRELKNKRLTDELRAKYAFVSTDDVGDNEPTVFGVKRNGMASGQISRRIYHFSGYFIITGKWCEEGSQDPECAGF